MNGDQQPTGNGQPQQDAVTPAPPPAQPVEVSKEVQEGKTFAILSYALSLIGLPFFLIPLIQRNNEFALYHAKQVLMIWLAAIALAVASGILSVICIGVILGIAGYIFLVVLDIMGLINAVKGLQKPLLLIGKWGEDWFKGLQKQA